MSNLDHIKRASSSTEINELIAGRWSPRAFAKTPVSAEDLEEDLHCGLMGSVLIERATVALSYGSERRRDVFEDS